MRTNSIKKIAKVSKKQAAPKSDGGLETSFDENNRLVVKFPREIGEKLQLNKSSQFACGIFNNVIHLSPIESEDTHVLGIPLLKMSNSFIPQKM